MLRASRIVEHLRLRGESESAVRHALPALEDAFRTASLPDAGARVICVRRMQLGRVAANASAQSVSLLIEKRFAEDGWTIVHGVERGADAAPAVWFRDAFEAHEAAALKIASGQPLDGWFWPLAIPAITAAASDERLRTIALAIASMEEAPAALPAWTASLVRAGYGSQLIAALRPGDGRTLMRAAGIRAVSTAARREHALSPDERHDATSQQVRTAPAERQRVADRGPLNEDLDDRAVFVELMTSRASGRLPQWPAASAPPPNATPAKTPDAVTSARDTSARARGEHGSPQPEARRAHGTRQPDPQRKIVEHQQVTPPDQPLVEPADAAGDTTRDEPAELRPPVSDRDDRRGRHPSSLPDVDGVHRERTTADPPHSLTSPWQIPDAAPTTAGGLLFLLPVLERVGFATWAAERGTEEPEPDIVAAQIFHLLLSRLGVDEEDSAWALAAAFRLKPEATQTHNPGFRLKPEDPTDIRGFRLQPEVPTDTRGFRLQAEGSEVAGTWLTASRRYLRRQARIGLASLVLRPARLAITPTHLDVFFRLKTADVRVRRAGLDIDPGWVPWFGRVVTFHYGDRPWN